MCVGIYLHACMCIIHVPSACGAQKRPLEHQELELPMIVFYQVGDGNQTWVICSNNKYFQSLSHLCSHYGDILITKKATV